MSNIFSKDEMEEIVRRIEESYNVAGKQVKMTIEIIDEVNNKEAREDEVRKAVYNLIEQLKDSRVKADQLLSENTTDYPRTTSGIIYNISTVRRRVFLITKVSLKNIDIEKYNHEYYKATITYRKYSTYKNGTCEYKIYMLIGKDNKIVDISEKDF